MQRTAEETLRIRRPGWRAGAAFARAASLWREHGAEAISFFALFLIGIARCFEMPSPYAVCCVAAMAYCGLPLGGALCGAAAASVYLMAFGQPADFAQAAACLMMAPLKYLTPGSLKRPTALVCLALLARGAFTAAQIAAPQTIVMTVVSAALGGVTVPSSVKAVKMIRSGQKDWSIDDLTCLIIPSLMVLSGLSVLRVLALNPGYAAAFLLVLLCGHLFGSPVAACAGAAAGFALMLAGHGALPPVLLTLGGACCGLTRGRGRSLSMMMLVAECMLMMYLLVGAISWTVMVSALGAGIAFLLIPAAAMKRIRRASAHLFKPSPGQNAYMKTRVMQWASQIEGVIDALPAPCVPEPDAESLCEELAERLCEGCERMTICWHEEYEKSKRSAARVVEASGDDEALIACVNAHYASCLRISDIPKIAARFESDRQVRLKRALNAEYERRMLSTHLSAMSQAVQLIALEDAEGADAESADWSNAVGEALLSMRFPGKTRFVRQIDGRFVVCLDVDPLAPRPCAGEELCRAVGIRLGASMMVSSRHGGQIMLVQQPPMAVCVGTATSCAVTPERRNLTYQVENGDAVLSDDLADGRALIALSDGMGHGEDAGKESKKTLELLAHCLKAGYSRTQAMTAVNGMMLSSTGGEQFATVDLCLFDRWTGDITIDKLGACASFLIRGQKVQVIEGAALPLGVIAHVIPTEYACALSEGDVLLLMSDGAADVFDREEWISVISRYLNEPPQRIADAVLQDALVRVNGMPQDDMTVVCVRAEGRTVITRE